MSFMRFKLGIACLFFDLILCLGPGLVLIHQFLETWASSSSDTILTGVPILIFLAAILSGPGRDTNDVLEVS